jgi:hypothetical protein
MQFVAIICVTIVSCLLIELWRRRQPATDQASGTIIVASGNMLQSDHWRYLAARSEPTPPVAIASPPILYGIEQVERAGLRMRIDDQGSITWTMALPANSRVAMLDRTVTAEPPPASFVPGSRSVLSDMARQLYLRAGLEIKGERISANQEWGSILISE